jgi:putative endonuclease
MTSPQKRRKAERRGRQAETLVAMRLRLKGWSKLASRYRNAYGEIDLIMRKPHQLLFVEVKYTSATSDETLETVLPQPRQQQRIVNAAKGFLAENPDYHNDEMRIVVALVQPYGRLRFIDDLFFDTF